MTNFAKRKFKGAKAQRHKAEGRSLEYNARGAEVASGARGKREEF